MNLNYLIILGVFVNLMLGGIFPYQLLDDTTRNAIIGDQIIGYDFTGSGVFDDNLKNTNGAFYSEVQNEESTASLIGTTNSTFTNIFSDTPVAYFDSIVDGMKKLKTIISMIIPFASMFFLLPGFIGYMLGSLYSVALIFAIIRFIRGA